MRRMHAWTPRAVAAGRLPWQLLAGSVSLPSGQKLGTSRGLRQDQHVRSAHAAHVLLHIGATSIRALYGIATSHTLTQSTSARENDYLESRPGTWQTPTRRQR